MNKDAAKDALQTIWTLMMNADNKTFYGKEIQALEKASAALRESVDNSLSVDAFSIQSMLNEGVLARPPGKRNNRETILSLCESMQNRLRD